MRLFAPLKLKPTLQYTFAEKTYLNALVLLYNGVRLLNKAKSRLFQSIMNFENLENCLDFVGNVKLDFGMLEFVIADLFSCWY